MRLTTGGEDGDGVCDPSETLKRTLKMKKKKRILDSTTGVAMIKTNENDGVDFSQIFHSFFVPPSNLIYNYREEEEE